MKYSTQEIKIRWELYLQGVALGEIRAKNLPAERMDRIAGLYALYAMGYRRAINGPGEVVPR